MHRHLFRRLLGDRPSRRGFLRAVRCGSMGVASAHWLPTLAESLAASDERRRQCILLWMTGGPSQIDTFDMKPQHANGGPFQEIATSVPGLRFCEHLPQLAQQADRLAIVRSLSTTEGDHFRGTHLVHTGHPPGGPVRYPSIGCAVSQQLMDPSAALPSYVSVGSAPFGTSSGAGFLGPRFAPTTVAGTGNPPDSNNEGLAKLGVDHLLPPHGVSNDRIAARQRLWLAMEQDYLAKHPASLARSHQTVYERAIRMMHPDARAAFDLTQESRSVRESYGDGLFGQGCLLARRLIERGVSFVEVSLGDGVGWDTHQNNFEQVPALCQQLDPAWSRLMIELAERGLLETTTILWIGEFGRTPTINAASGRDHFPQAWSCVFAGGGIAGGQIYGRTSDDGGEVVDNPAAVGDVLATLCQALGFDPEYENMTPEGRPIQIAEGNPLIEILA